MGIRREFEFPVSPINIRRLVSSLHGFREIIRSSTTNVEKENIALEGKLRYR
jgi:hypothetical protein